MQLLLLLMQIGRRRQTARSISSLLRVVVKKASALVKRISSARTSDSENEGVHAGTEDIAVLHDCLIVAETEGDEREMAADYVTPAHRAGNKDEIVSYDDAVVQVEDEHNEEENNSIIDDGDFAHIDEKEEKAPNYPRGFSAS